MRAATAALLLLLLPPAAAFERKVAAPKPDPRAFEAYRELLRREVGISLPAGNLSVEPERVVVRKPMKARHLVTTIPSKYVITVTKALGSSAGGYINRNSANLPRTLPRHFVLAMWLLVEKHMTRPGGARGLFHAWIDTLPPMDNCTVFWTSDELDELEEERVTKRSRARRQQSDGEFVRMVQPLLQGGGLEDDLPNGVTVGPDEYAWAVAVVTKYSLHFAADFPVLVPISFRFHPQVCNGRGGRPWLGGRPRLIAPWRCARAGCSGGLGVWERAGAVRRAVRGRGLPPAWAGAHRDGRGAGLQRRAAAARRLRVGRAARDEGGAEALVGDARALGGGRRRTQRHRQRRQFLRGGDGL